MEDFLNKEITDISDDDFHKKFGIFITNEDTKRELLAEFTRIRLQKNNEFAIKEVFDEETFYDNSKVLKEVVELLQSYRFRYAKKQPFL
jgi:type I restriction enzyme M protein